MRKIFLWGVKGDYRGATSKELFSYFFGIYIKFGYKKPSILASSDLVDVAT